MLWNQDELWVRSSKWQSQGFSILKGITVFVYNLYYYYTLLDYTNWC